MSKNHIIKPINHDNKFPKHINTKVNHTSTNKNYTNIFKNLIPYIPMFGMLAITGIVTINLHTLPTSADPLSSKASVTVSASCSFTGDITEVHEANIINGQYKEDIGTTTLRTYCNDANGYQIYAIGYSNDEDGNTNLIEELPLDSTDTPNAITTGLYPGTGNVLNSTPSSWSMKLSAISGTFTPTIESDTNGSFSQYHIIPSTSTLVASYAAGTVGSHKTDSSLTTTYDSFINQTQPTGTYTGKVKYTMLQTAAIYKLYMQNMTSSDCTTTARTVYDIRDEEEYLVQRLADNNCWMLDNLRLGSTSEIALTSDNSNTNGNYELPAGITSGFNSYTAAQINSANKDNTTTSYGSGSGKVGVYYNYCAASAGTICMSSNSGSSAQYDVCPAGWRMPTGGSSGEYQALYAAYSSNVTNFRNALSTPLSGYFRNSSQSNLGSNGYFWSSTYYTTYSMYYLSVNSSNVNPQDYSDRVFGVSVRCVLK